MFRKITALLSTVCIAISFSACGNKEKNNDSSAEKPVVSTTEGNDKNTEAETAEVTTKKPTQKDSPRHMLTIIDDDGCNTFYDNMLPIMEEKGVSFSTAVETGNVGTEDYMSWDRIEECNKRGAEILNHSRDHICSKEDNENRTDDEIKDDMSSSLEMLKEHGYSDTADIYVYPGASAGRTWSIAKQYFRVGINSSGSKTNEKGFNRFNVSRYPVGSKEVPTYDEMKGYVDEVASTGNGWQIWMIHSHNGNITPEALDDICRIIDYCKDNEVEIVSAKEALDYYDELK